MRPLSREHAATIVAPTLSGTAADAVAPVTVDVLYRPATGLRLLNITHVQARFFARMDRA